MEGGICNCIVRSLLVAIMLALSPLAKSQDAPLSYNHSSYRNIPPLILDSLLLQTARIENSPDHAGNVIPLDLDSDNSGEWKQYNPQYDTWTLKLKVDDVAGIAVVFASVLLHPDARIFVCTAEEFAGPFARDDIAPSGILPVGYLKGNELVVELDVPAGSRLSSLLIHAVATTDNVGLLPSSVLDSDKRTDTCYPCLTGNFWDDLKRSTVKIVTFRDAEAIMCTGVLVNNTAGDATPYILTAQHCITNQDDADKALFMFCDVDVSCDGPISLERSSMAGGILRASSFAHDFSLVELRSKIPLEAHPYFAGWDITDNNPGNVSCVHHPLGGSKRVSLSREPIVTSNFEEEKVMRARDAFWRVDHWNEGFTERGSSGAALFNAQQQIVGTLTGGSSHCSAPYDDYFEKLTLAWNDPADGLNQLHWWLDPSSTQKEILEGFDPFEGFHVTCDTLSNINHNEVTALVPFPGGNGFLSGCTGNGQVSYAESFEIRDGKITGLQCYVASINAEANGGISFSIAEDNGGLPGASLADVYVPYKDLHLYFNYISLYPYVPADGKTFVVYTLTCAAGDSFALEVASWRESGLNTAYMKFDSVWSPLSTSFGDEKGTSLYIEPMVCKTSEEVVATRQILTCYPNPVSDDLIIKLPDEDVNIIDIQLCGVDGKRQPVKFQVYQNDIVLSTSSLNSAPYVVKVITATKVYVTRMIKL